QRQAEMRRQRPTGVVVKAGGNWRPGQRPGGNRAADQAILSKEFDIAAQLPVAGFRPGTGVGRAGERRRHQKHQAKLKEALQFSLSPWIRLLKKHISRGRSCLSWRER